MEVIKTKLKGCVIIKPKVYADKRGFFVETYQKNRYEELANIKESFVQDNRSKSTKSVLRGLHFQLNNPQGKLVSVTSGSVYDVAVDLRKGSPTFGEYESIVLSDENHLQFYVPPGFAHGFVVLSESAEFLYKCTEYYDPLGESSIRWDDPVLNIKWPESNPILSVKDETARSFLDYCKGIE